MQGRVVEETRPMGASNPGNGQNEDDQGGYNENPKCLAGYHVHTLHASKREKKLVQRSVNMVEAAIPRYLKYSEIPITWSREDHPPNIEHPGLLALVVAPQVAGYSLNKVLMDGGSAINILYYETFLRMNLKKSQLQPVVSRKSDTGSKGYPLFRFSTGREGGCRGGITADAIGWLKLWARISVRESGEGVCVQRTHMQVKQESSKKPRTRTTLQEQGQRSNHKHKHTGFTLLRGP